MTDITTDFGTIDNVIINLNLSAIVYESLISDHRPLILTNIDTYIEIANNIDTENTENVTHSLK